MNGAMIAAEKKPREIWVEFGSNPSPLLHSFATIVPVFFIYFVLFTEWGMGGGGYVMKRRKKKLHRLLEKKKFLTYLIFAVCCFLCELFSGAIQGEDIYKVSDPDLP